MHQQHVDLRKPSELVSAHSKKMMLSSGKPVSKMNPSIISTEIKKHLNNQNLCGEVRGFMQGIQSSNLKQPKPIVY